MANFHSDEWIMAKLQEHYSEALKFFPKDRIVGIFYQGSGNYGLDTENSDVDSKLIVIPSLDEICLNLKPWTETHVRKNKEHIDFKDVRLMFGTFYKQNLNFLEILFTKYKIINPTYLDLWTEVVNNRELIAHYNKNLAVKAMNGIAYGKYSSLKKGIDENTKTLTREQNKALYQLLRTKEYLLRYSLGEPYEACIKSEIPEYLKKVKEGKLYTPTQALTVAGAAIAEIEKIKKEMIAKPENGIYDRRVIKVLHKAQKEIITRSLSLEILDLYGRAL